MDISQYCGSSVRLFALFTLPIQSSKRHAFIFCSHFYATPRGTTNARSRVRHSVCATRISLYHFLSCDWAHPHTDVHVHFSAETIPIPFQFQFRSLWYFYTVNESIPLQESRFIIPIFEESFQHASVQCPHSPDEESTSSMASGLLRSFCDQTPYCRSLYLLKPVVKRRPVSPRYTTYNAREI